MNDFNLNSAAEHLPENLHGKVLDKILERSRENREMSSEDIRNAVVHLTLLVKHQSQIISALNAELREAKKFNV